MKWTDGPSCPRRAACRRGWSVFSLAMLAVAGTAAGDIVVNGSDAEKKKINDAIKYLKDNSATAKKMLERAESKPEKINLKFGETIDIATADPKTYDVIFYESAINRLKQIDKPGGGGKALEAAGFNMILAHEVLGHIQNQLDKKPYGEPEAVAVEQAIQKELGLPQRLKYFEKDGGKVVVPYSDGSKLDMTDALKQDKTGKDGEKKKFTSYETSGKINVIGRADPLTGGVALSVDPKAGSNSIMFDLTAQGGGMQEVQVQDFEALMVGSENPEMNAQFADFKLVTGDLTWYGESTGTSLMHFMEDYRAGAGTTDFTGAPTSFEFSIALDALFSNELFTSIIGTDSLTMQILAGFMTFDPSSGCWVGTISIDGMGFAPVPAPGAIMLLAFGGGMLLRRRR